MFEHILGMLGKDHKKIKKITLSNREEGVGVTKKLKTLTFILIFCRLKGCVNSENRLGFHNTMMAQFKFWALKNKFKNI